MEALSRSFHALAAKPWNALIEVSLLAVLLYYVYRYFRGTRGARVLAGFTLFAVVLTALSESLGLVVLRWLVERSAVFLVVVLAVVFQPELRRIFADLGSRTLFSGRKQDERALDKLCDCIYEMASRHCGALVAIERGIGLRSYAETGVNIDAAFTPELLQTIFFPKTALHDGGVILRDERIIAAACIFPVTQRESLDRSFGLRHRAGLGLSEETDAVAIVVSEETGSVSLCFGHAVRRGLTRVELRLRLGEILLDEAGPPRAPVPELPVQVEEEQDLENA